jgi:hypothetical protein
MLCPSNVYNAAAAPTAPASKKAKAKAKARKPRKQHPSIQAVIDAYPPEVRSDPKRNMEYVQRIRAAREAVKHSKSGTTVSLSSDQMTGTSEYE